MGLFLFYYDIRSFCFLVMQGGQPVKNKTELNCGKEREAHHPLSHLLTEGAYDPALIVPWRELKHCLVAYAKRLLGNNSAISRICGISQSTVRRWLESKDHSTLSAHVRKAGKRQRLTIPPIRLRELERCTIIHALAQVQGDPIPVGVALQISRASIYRRMNTLGVAYKRGRRKRK